MYPRSAMPVMLAVGLASCVSPPRGHDLPATGAAGGPVVLHVAPDGNDTNPGSRNRPFATLERARDAIRGLRSAGGLPPGGVTVLLHEGRYELATPFELTAADSGDAAAPIEYRAEAGADVRIRGGRELAGWERVRDEAVLARLPSGARGKVFQTDLRRQGITDLEGINNPGVYRSDPGLELFFRDQPMTLARYPNRGYVHMAEVLDANGVAKSGRASTAEGRFICNDPRAGQWAGAQGAWLHGFWVWDWADERIPLGGVDAATNTVALQPRPGHSRDLRRGQWFYAENLLCELDAPGEWYLDREAGVLYFWPPRRLSAGSAAVSVVRDLFRLSDVSHLTLRGLLVECGRGSAVVVKGGANVHIVGCTFRNLGNWAVRVSGGTAHGVVGCDIYQTGQGGIHLEGGDRRTLTAAGHYADNNHIHHTSRWDPVYQQAIALRGVGNRATHNLIDNVPHIAIGFADNDMTIEYNEIHSAVFQSNDAGAIYTSPPDETWSMRGHRIRFNYLHSIHGFEGRGCLGVYLDDCFSSADISSNVFYDVATAILIGGGRDNLMTNNLFVNCGRAFSIDARGLGWAKGVGVFATKELHELNYRQPPWSLRYPELLGILEDEPLAPKGNVMARNVCWGGPWGWTEPKALPLVQFADNLVGTDPLFAGQPPADFSLRPDSPALKLGFKPIPCTEIGVYGSPDRASWPVTSVLRKDPIPPVAKPKPARQAGPAPVYAIRRLAGAVNVDGRLSADEGLGPNAGEGLVLREGVNGEKVAFQSRAWLAWDDEALYIAFANDVDPAVPMQREDSWGANDAVEVALANPALGTAAPILVLRGFTNGTFVSSQEAGAPAEVARKAGEGVRYAATVVNAGLWVAELRVPFASLGIRPTAEVRLPLNLSVRKQGADPWVMWRGTGNCTWYVSEAGRVHFVR